MSQEKIATPLKLQFKRMRQQLVPVVVFVVVCVLVGWLWSRHTQRGQIVGRIEANRFAVVSHVDGLLLTQTDIAPLALVSKGQVIARVRRIAPEVASAKIDVVRAQIQVLNAELGTLKVTGAGDVQKLNHDLLVEARRLALRLEELKIDLLDRVSSVESDRIKFQRLEELVALLAKGGGSRIELMNAKMQRDVIAKKIAENTTAKGLVESQIQAAQERIKNHRLPSSEDFLELLKPIQKSIELQRETIQLIRKESQPIELVSPCDGYFSRVMFKNNQSVAAGQEIYEIVQANITHPVVLCYVRDHQIQNLSKNHQVSVFLTRGSRQIQVKGTILEAGRVVEPIPQSYLPNATMPEWGVPVRIQIPNTQSVRMNEQVSVRLR